MQVIHSLNTPKSYTWTLAGDAMPTVESVFRKPDGAIRQNYQNLSVHLPSVRIDCLSHMNGLLQFRGPDRAFWIAIVYYRSYQD